MKKIESCSMESQPTYKYEIEYNGDVIAKCKMLSNLEIEQMVKEPTPLRQQYRAITLSIEKWAFVDEKGHDLPIDFHSLDKIIAPEYIVTMAESIFKKMNEWRVQKEAVLKN